MFEELGIFGVWEGGGVDGGEANTRQEALKQKQNIRNFIINNFLMSIPAIFKVKWMKY